jgi:hypothetical protein
MSNDIHLFLLVPNDSGSTWLQNNISLCENVISFKEGLDGKGVCAGTGAYPCPELDSNKLFTENIIEEFDWDVIKNLWSVEWGKSNHYKTTNPRVFLEKTPQAVFFSDHYVEQFDNVRFIIMIRHPYAVAEGTRRTIRQNPSISVDVSIERCVKHWIKCAQRQMYNARTYADCSLEIKYEDLVGDPRMSESKIKSFLPALHDLDLTKAASANTLDGPISLPITDFNQRHIDNLTIQDVRRMNRELVQVPEVLEYFGYERSLLDVW